MPALSEERGRGGVGVCTVLREPQRIGVLRAEGQLQRIEVVLEAHDLETTCRGRLCLRDLPSGNGIGRGAEADVEEHERRTPSPSRAAKRDGTT